jgi:hypothetical protein
MLDDRNTHFERCTFEAGSLERGWRVVMDATKEEDADSTLENGPEFDVLLRRNESLCAG